MQSFDVETGEILHWVAIAGMVTETVGSQLTRMSGVPVSLEASARLPRKMQTQTRSDGSFYFVDLPPGTYTLKVEAGRDRHHTQAVTVKPKERNRKADFDWISIDLSRT